MRENVLHDYTSRELNWIRFKSGIRLSQADVSTYLNKSEKAGIFVEKYLLYLKTTYIIPLEMKCSESNLPLR